MRFTKIPLIATLMAVALSLLIVLPALGQASDFDDPRGTLSSGSDLTVEVLDSGGNMLAESYFDGNLYVSSDDEAHDTVRITAQRGNLKVFPGADGEMGEAPNADDTNMAEQDTWPRTMLTVLVATVENVRSGKDITVACCRARTRITTTMLATTVVHRTCCTFDVIPAGVEEANGRCVDFDRHNGPGRVGGQDSGAPRRHAAHHGRRRLRQRRRQGRRRGPGVRRDLP